MSIEKIPEPWRTFLLEIDQLLEVETVFHCIGGFVVTTLYGSSRQTRDLDVILVRPFAKLLDRAGRGSDLHKKQGIYLDLVGIAKVPENYEDRLVEMFPGVFERLKLFGLDPYDLALSKIERNTDRDRQDVSYLAKAVPFDLNKLRQLYQHELRPDLFIPEREDLTLKLWIEMIEEEVQ